MNSILRTVVMLVLSLVAAFVSFGSAKSKAEAGRPEERCGKIL